MKQIKSGVVDDWKAIRNRAEMKAFLSRIVDGYNPVLEDNFEHELNRAMRLQQDTCFIIGMKIIYQKESMRPNGFISNVSKFNLPCGFELNYTYNVGDSE